jgi:hypothetical protein
MHSEHNNTEGKSSVICCSFECIIECIERASSFNDVIIKNENELGIGNGISVLFTWSRKEPERERRMGSA